MSVVALDVLRRARRGCRRRAAHGCDDGPNAPSQLRRERERDVTAAHGRIDPPAEGDQPLPGRATAVPIEGDGDRSTLPGQDGGRRRIDARSAGVDPAAAEDRETDDDGRCGDRAQ